MARFLNRGVALLGVIYLCVLFSCANRSIKFIDIANVLENSSDSLQQKHDLISVLYLRPELLDTVNNLYPNLLSKRQKEPGYFSIDESDQLTVELSKEYGSIDDVITSLAESTISSLKQKFGISNPKTEMNNRVVIDRQKGLAYVEFHGQSSIHGLTFKLERRNHLNVRLAFIIIE